MELKGTKVYHRKRSPQALRCALPIRKGPRGFLAPDGSPLAVPLGRADTTNPANDPFSFDDLSSGRAAWGFGWFGSYCGAPPRYVVLKLANHRGALNVPYDGPTPACATDSSGTSSSTLTDGPAGGPDSSVQPAPPSFTNLTTSARFAGSTTTRRPAPVDVTISNTSAQPVTLVPCPEYEIQTDDHTGKREHFSSISIDGSTPGCKKSTVTIQPGQPLTFRIPSDEVEPGSPFGASKGSTFDVEVEMAGMPTAEASTTVQ